MQREGCRLLLLQCSLETTRLCGQPPVQHPQPFSLPLGPHPGSLCQETGEYHLRGARPEPPLAQSLTCPREGTRALRGFRGPPLGHLLPRLSTGSMEPPGAQLPSAAPAAGSATSAADTYVFVQR